MNRRSVMDTMGEFLEEMEIRVKAGEKEPATLSNYRQAFKCFHLQITKQWISEVTHSDLVPVIFESRNSKNGEYLAQTTMRRMYACLDCFFKWCIFQGYITGINPLDRIPKPKDRSEKLPTPSSEQYFMLKNALPYVYKDLITLFAQFGRRAGEFINNERRSFRHPVFVPLRTIDEYGDIRVFQAKVKHSSRNWILDTPIPNEQIYQIIKKYIKEGNIIDFGITYRDFYRVITRINKALKPEFEQQYPHISFVHITPHSLRRFCSDEMRDNGVSDEDNAGALGHTSTQQLNKYRNFVNRDALKAAYNRIAV